jgi:alpha-D-ribose 1-methylphosphonate 5-triphosphate diphosphatase
MTTAVYRNAKIVTEHEIVEGWMASAAGQIVEVGAGKAPETGSIDFEGDLLIPGLVELHTDHLEAHVVPRPKVRWHVLSAVLAYDAQMAASGITTVFDSLRVGSDFDSRSLGKDVFDLMATITSAQADGLLRADHRLHLRCELCADDVLEATRTMAASHSVGMISLMDHTPGSRQFRDVSKWKTYYGGKSGLSDSALDAMVDDRLRLHAANHDKHRAEIVALARDKAIVLASHDDTTLDHVSSSVADGVSIAEFPTTMDAAGASRQAGIHVLMGAPNIVRGGSHSGNVAAEALARDGLLDILSSDYVPSSLLVGAFELARRVDSISLPDAIRTVTLNPAVATGLVDRGAIRPGFKADFLLVRLHGPDQLPVVREVYRDGRRII